MTFLQNHQIYLLTQLNYHFDCMLLPIYTTDLFTSFYGNAVLTQQLTTLINYNMGIFYNE